MRGALVLALSACGSSGSSTSGSDEPEEPFGASPEVEAFAADYLEAYCAAAARCCANDPEFSIARCREHDLTDIGLALARQSKYVFRADMASACLAELATAVICRDDTPASCSAAIEGTVPTGGTCRSTYDCAYRRRLLDTCPYREEGELICKGPVGAGERCGLNEAGICLRSDGLQCDDVTHRCVALFAAGSPCSYSTECAEGLRCVMDVCGPGKVAGDPCTSQDDCAEGNFCSGGNRCNVVWPAGTACDPDVDWYACGEDGICENGTCRTYRERDVCQSSNWL
jgi:hypothetical protein